MKAGLDNWIDILILVAYFVFVFVVGILVNYEEFFFSCFRVLNYVTDIVYLFLQTVSYYHFILISPYGGETVLQPKATFWLEGPCSGSR